MRLAPSPNTWSGPRQVPGQHDAREAGQHEAEEQEAAQRERLLFEVRRERAPRPGEHDGELRPGLDGRVGEERLLPLRLARHRARASRRGELDGARPIGALGGARSVGRVDDLAALTDEHGVGLGRQVLVQRGRDDVVLREGDHADERAVEAALAHERLDHLERATEQRLVRDAELRPEAPARAAANHGRSP
jgi:hypothetical protein